MIHTAHTTWRRVGLGSPVVNDGWGGKTGNTGNKMK